MGHRERTCPHCGRVLRTAFLPRGQTVQQHVEECRREKERRKGGAAKSAGRDDTDQAKGSGRESAR